MRYGNSKLLVTSISSCVSICCYNVCSKCYKFNIRFANLNSCLIIRCDYSYSALLECILIYICFYGIVPFPRKLSYWKLPFQRLYSNQFALAICFVPYIECNHHYSQTESEHQRKLVRYTALFSELTTLGMGMTASSSNNLASLMPCDANRYMGVLDSITFIVSQIKKTSIFEQVSKDYLFFVSNVVEWKPNWAIFLCDCGVLTEHLTLRRPELFSHVIVVSWLSTSHLESLMIFCGNLSKNVSCALRSIVETFLEPVTLRSMNLP